MCVDSLILEPDLRDHSESLSDPVGHSKMSE